MDIVDHLSVTKIESFIDINIDQIIDRVWAALVQIFDVTILIISYHCSEKYKWY
jgi:hypothetical protein